MEPGVERLSGRGTLLQYACRACALCMGRAPSAARLPAVARDDVRVAVGHQRVLAVQVQQVCGVRGWSTVRQGWWLCVGAATVGSRFSLPPLPSSPAGSMTCPFQRSTVSPTPVQRERAYSSRLQDGRAGTSGGEEKRRGGRMGDGGRGRTAGSPE